MVTENLKYFKRITGRITLKLLALDWTQRLNALSIRPNAVQPPQSFNRRWERDPLVFYFVYETKSTSQKISSVSEHCQEPS
jgi:hypothetical protein